MRKLSEKSAKTIENTANLTPSINAKVDEISKRIDKFEEIINKINDRAERTEKSTTNQLTLMTKAIEANSKELTSMTKAIEANSEEIQNKKFSLFGK